MEAPTLDLSALVASGPGALTGRALGGFELKDLVGSGAYGDVYLAEQVALRREAIVKVLRSGATDEIRIQRFLREAQLASRLDHPYAAHIYAFGAEPDGVFWIAMEHVRGSSLRAVLAAQGPMPLERFVPLLERICEVVHTAHEQAIVHRDLKPDNVMVIPRAGRLLPKLLDFGIARAVGNDDAPSDSTILGLPAYMAPELWVAPDSAGPPADQYALAALSYEALTGRLAFSGRSVREVARAHAKGKLAPLGDGLPAALESVILRAIARKPDQRYGNVLELADAFRAASGIGRADGDLPQLDEALRVRFVTGAPRPLAELVAAFDAARNAHQAREALRGIVRSAAWYVGILALASRTRVGSGGAGDSERARELLRELRRAGLSPAGWIALARQLTQPFVRVPDTHPLPELVLLLHPGAGPNGGSDGFAVALEGSLSESLADGSEDAASQAIARELPIVAQLLRALEFLLDYELVIASGGRVESWMGVRGAPRRRPAPLRALPEGQPVLVDAAGAPLLVTWPLIQLHPSLPGHGDQLFLLAGPGRTGARLVSAPHGFEHHDAALWEWFRDNLLDSHGARPGDAVADSPYRGLSAYAAGDAGMFFGREREVELVVNRLRLDAFVAIVGPSGVGKSSFIHAGVAPALGWRVVTTRPGRTPIAQLAATLGVELPDDPAAAAERLRGAAGDGLLLVIDQFEELLALGSPPAERDRFARLLIDATRTTEVPLRVVITLRDDFLIRAERLPGFDVALARGLQLLGPLGRDALERVLVEPARRAGYEFDDKSLPAAMVAEAGDTPAAVALVSFTASRLWELRDRHFLQLSRKSYDAIGGVAGALARHADDTIDQLPPSERALARKAFRHLVTFEGTRASLERVELRQLCGGGDEAERLIERLVESRLVTAADTERGGSIEIVHETLVTAWPRLAGWRREDAEGSRFHEQLRAAARQWQDRGRPRGLLWRGDALAEYQLWRRRRVEPLTPSEAAFGDASDADALRGRRIRRALTAIALVTTFGFVVVLWRANSAAQEARGSAESLLRDSYFEQGRLKMLAGDKLGALPELESARDMGQTGAGIELMIDEASRGRRAQVASLDGHTDKVWDVAYSPDGRWIATAGGDGTTRIFDAETGVERDVIHHETPTHHVVFSPDGTILASDSDHALSLWDVARRAPRTPLPAASDTVHKVAFSADGSEIATLTTDLQVRRVADGGLVGELPQAGFLFCARADCLVTWTHGKVVVRDAATLAPRRTYEHGPGIASVAIDGTASLIAIGTPTGGLALSRADGTVTVIPEAHTDYVHGLDISRDGTIVATGSDDRTAKLWDARTGTLRFVLAGHRGNVSFVRFSPRGDQLVTASADGTARLWSTSTGALLAELAGHRNLVFAAAFRPDGKRLATASWDHRVLVWDITAEHQERVLEPPRLDLDGPHARAAFAPSNDRVAFVARDGSLVITDVDSDARACRAPSDKPIGRVVWLGDSVATIEDDDRRVELWHASDCAHERTIAMPAPVRAIAAGTAGVLIVATQHEVLVVDARTGAIDARFDDLPAELVDIGYDPGSKRVFALLDGPVWVQDLSRAAPPLILRGSELNYTSVAFDPVRHRVFAGSTDQHVWVWDDRTGAREATLECSGPVETLRISESSLVALGGLDPIVFDLATLQPSNTLVAHVDFVDQGDLLDRGLIVTTSRDQTYVWELDRSQPLLRFPPANNLLVSPDHQVGLFLTEGSGHLWRLHMK